MNGAKATGWILASWLVIPLIVALDFATKQWVAGRYYLWEVDPILGDLVRLTLVHNTGAAFGILQAYPGLFKIITTTAIVVIAAHKILTTSRSRLYHSALGLILSGAIGNVIDRYRFNHVIDFIDVGVGDLRWPAFNVADAAISTGVCLLLVISFMTPKPARTGAEPNTEREETACFPSS